MKARERAHEQAHGEEGQGTSPLSPPPLSPPPLQFPNEPEMLCYQLLLRLVGV